MTYGWSTAALFRGSHEHFTARSSLRHADAGSNPGFAAVAVLTIGIGIGASHTIFGWMASLLLNPLPGARQAERIVAIENTAPDGEPLTTFYLDFRRFPRQSQARESRDPRAPANVFSVGDGPRAKRKPLAKWCRATCFDSSDVQPEAGRFFSQARNTTMRKTCMRWWSSAIRLEDAFTGLSVQGRRGRPAHQSQQPVHHHRCRPGGFPWRPLGLDYEIWMPLTMYVASDHPHVGCCATATRATS